MGIARSCASCMCVWGLHGVLRVMGFWGCKVFWVGRSRVLWELVCFTGVRGFHGRCRASSSCREFWVFVGCQGELRRVRAQSRCKASGSLRLGEV